ncbi:MAG: hypothetical protein HUU01_20650 [Saprospiraceae bacterium]|nr:hypothetical protein [Saprospiraceae bacterium]
MLKTRSITFYLFFFMPLVLGAQSGREASLAGIEPGSLHQLSAAKAPVLTYYQHIKPIIDKHCTGCHRAGQAAPFPLTSYEAVQKRAHFIQTAVETRYMPPWHADPAFRSFHNENRLSSTDIQLIADWVAGGAKSGKQEKKAHQPNNMDQQPAFVEPDLRLTMQQPFEIPGDNTEQFRIFVIPTHTEEVLYVRGIGFHPGNLQQAHHARLMIDTTNLLRPDDGAVAGDPNTEFTRRQVKMSEEFWHGWVPGNFPILYPEGFGKRLPKNADLILNMHYSPTPKPETDQSAVSLYLCREKPRRLVKTFALGEQWITNQPFVIPANTEIKFYMRSPILPADLSLATVMPHMHLLGKSFKAYAITPKGELIHLIHIPVWDFKWQMIYQFDKLLKLPKGSVIYAEAVFDNTKSNSLNPNPVPRDVTYGWGTKDEMMNLIFEYLDYEEGDETLNLFNRN